MKPSIRPSVRPSVHPSGFVVVGGSLFVVSFVYFGLGFVLFRFPSSFACRQVLACFFSHGTHSSTGKRHRERKNERKRERERELGKEAAVKCTDRQTSAAAKKAGHCF